MKTHCCDCCYPANVDPDACGCCEGIEILTPLSIYNRPGLSEISYRIGTHAGFLETMTASLTGYFLEKQDGQGNIQKVYPLKNLTTRDASDPSLALLDAWATVADVLTFYQERIVNEGFLRTATERRSIVELARLVGYKPRPGVAASVFLAYTLDDNVKEDVIIPRGARSQSIPGPGELPQSFEVSEDLKAQAKWNNLKPRMTRPQKISLENVLTIERIYVEGTAANLKVNDHLLFVFDKGKGKQTVRRVKEAIPLAAENKTEVRLQTIFSDIESVPMIEAVLDLLPRFSANLTSQIVANAFDDANAANRAQKKLLDFQQSVFLGAQPNLLELPSIILGALDTNDSTLENFVDSFISELGRLAKIPLPHPQPILNLSQLFIPLLKKPFLQPINSLRLRRSFEQAFHQKSDVTSQLLINFSPALNENFYGAWANADVNSAISSLQAVYVLRVSAPLFGYNAAQKMALIPNPNTSISNKIPFISAVDGDWLTSEPGDESAEQLFLDNAYEGVLPGGYALIEKVDGGEIERLVMPIKSVQVRPRTAYGLSTKTTQLGFADDWWNPQSNDMSLIRRSLVRTQSEPLKLAEQPIEQGIGVQKLDQEAGKRIELGELYPGLQSGRWIIVSGERSDTEGTSGVMASELVMLSSVEQGFDNKLPGDKTLSTLVFATSLAYSYKRDTVKIYGNTVKATHGETRKEVLGSGDGAKVLQSFVLKQPLLTYVSASNPSGVDSTLKVFVNNIQWHETDALAGLSPTDRNFISKTDNESKTTVIFGNGREGVRLPSGIENIKAEYRNGIGRAGNVKAEQISLLLTKPLGVKEVINPLRALGGADRETRDQARQHAPLAVKALDRLVSTQDYEDFSHIYAGIGKANAIELSNGRQPLIHVTIAGAGDIPIDTNSDLFRNLYQALYDFGDPFQKIQLAVRELLMIVIEAGVAILPDYQWESVVSEVRSALLDQFSFERRELGQDVFLSEILSAMQSVRGVAYVDVDAFGGIPEKIAEGDGKRRLLTPNEISEAVDCISTRWSVEDMEAKCAGQTANPECDKYKKCKKYGNFGKTVGVRQRLQVNLADFENGAIRPAQLAFVSPDVPATLILNQIERLP